MVSAPCMWGMEKLTTVEGVQENMHAKGVFDLSSQSMNAAQGLTMTCGLIGGLYLAVFQVAKEGKSIGQLTTFMVYWAQLQGNFVFETNGIMLIQVQVLYRSLAVSSILYLTD